MPAPTDPLPEWASNANHPAGSDAWSGQPNKDDTARDLIAQTGFVPAEPVEAEGVNAWLNLLHQHIQAAGLGAFHREGVTTDRTIVGTETLNADLYVETLTVPNGTILITAGWRIFADVVTVEVGGVIHNDGDGGGLNGAGANPEDGGAGGAEGYLGGGGTGATGATLANTNGSQASAVVGKLGGNGGAGGDDGDANTGGASQTGTAFPDSAGQWRVFPRAIEQRSFDFDGTYQPMRGGVGGSSGANDATGGGQAGGGGGGGGGIVVICARRIENDGEIRANGGEGGDGFQTVGVGAGGGGGGGGGLVVIACREYTGSGDILVDGGAGGAAALGGVAGSAGSEGQTLQLTF